MNNHTMEDLVSLCKRRGFIFQSNELYGGLQGLYDYGPLGVELKNNLKRAWWKSMIYDRDDIEGIDSSILTNGMRGLAELLDKINEKVREKRSRDNQIGHS